MTEPRLCVVLGAPRSGTTWAQRLLSAVPGFSAPQETHLFGEYLRPLFEKWEEERPRVMGVVEDAVHNRPPSHRFVGLPTILEDHHFLALCRAFVEAVVEQVRASSPGVRWVVEKTPSNSLVVPQIEALVPGCRYLHIVRDPRDVVRSLLSAGEGWGADWAPQRVGGACRTWTRHFEGARQAATLAPERYLEMRYEHLRSNPARHLGTILHFLGEDVREDQVQAAVEAEARASHSGRSDFFATSPSIAGRLGGAAVSEPAGFRGASTARTFTLLERARIYDELASHINALGYELRPQDQVSALTRSGLRGLRAARQRFKPAGSGP